MSKKEKTTQAGFKVIRRVTLPTLKMEEDTPVYIKFEAPMFVSKAKQKQDAQGNTKQPPTVATVINLETGEECQMVLGAVIVSTLTEDYPDNDYVGRGFEIVKHAKKEGKNYRTYSISEVALDD